MRKGFLELVVCGSMCLFSQSLMAQTVYVQIENEAVFSYLNRVKYTRESATQIDDYLVAADEQRLDIPRPAVLSLPRTMADSLTVWYGEESDLSDATKLQVSRQSPRIEIYNLIPEHVYYYQIEADGEVLKQGEIRPRGTVRMIYLPSVRNVRDMGGWVNEDGLRIRYGMIFRGSELNGDHVADSTDLETLKQLGVGAEIDMRYSDENEGSGISALGFEEGDDYLFTDNSGCCDPSHLTSYHWTSRYRKEFEFIVASLKQGRSVYHHCVWGADRTGMLALLMEGLLGIDYDQMMKDYELTSFYSYRQKDNIDYAIDYIETLPGATLQEKFLYYFVQKLYVRRADVSYFIETMLEENDITVGVEELKKEKLVKKVPAVFDLQGRRVRGEGQGLKIMVGSDGSRKKVLTSLPFSR